MIGVNTAGIVPAAPKAALTTASVFLFAMALAALGLATDLRKLKEKGPRPLVVGALAWVFVTCFALVLTPLLPA
jgi:uncharacterized membrane protein YadS